MGAPTAFDGCRSARRGYSREIAPGNSPVRIFGLNAGPTDRPWWGTVYVYAEPTKPIADADDGSRVVLDVQWDLDGSVVNYEVDLARGVAIRFPGGRGQVDARALGSATWIVAAQGAIGTTPPVARPSITTYGVDTVRVPIAPTCYEAIALSQRPASAFGTAQVNIRAYAPSDATLATVLTAAGFPPPPCPAMPGQAGWEAAGVAPRNQGIAVVQYLGA